MNLYHRKLYAFLRSPVTEDWGDEICQRLSCLVQDREALQQWWNACQARDIAASSDRVNLVPTSLDHDVPIPIRHPISGESAQVKSYVTDDNRSIVLNLIPDSIQQESDPQKVFWWFWRFYPELLVAAERDALLFPAHQVLPDCPLHSHQATVSALAGALYPSGWTDSEPADRPYLLLFTFSPVQEFIKASRKFLDFWAGSYLLHYLSAKLCWFIAQTYGPDAIIVPSLWHQEIIDAWILKVDQTGDTIFSTELVEAFKQQFRELRERRTVSDRGLPVEEFSQRRSTSLSTAGFPNMITALIPERDIATFGDTLAAVLQDEWKAIGKQVKLHIRERVSATVQRTLNTPQALAELQQALQGDNLSLSESDFEPFRQDLKHWQPQQNQFGQATYPGWTWDKLWTEQLDHTWEPYWAAVPLGDPDKPLQIKNTGQGFDQAWKDAQKALSQAWLDLPSIAEEQTFETLNVGTWWGSLQQRLRLCVQAVKNTRVWQIPVAPGERSTLSGQFSAVHPNLNYQVMLKHGTEQDLRQGAGLPAGSMRLFWYMMSQAYPGLFNGSEKLNALELTKRMAWIYGGVAESLGIEVSRIKTVIEHREQRQSSTSRINQSIQLLYEQFIRFPNLSSIAAARFIHDYPEKTKQYWQNLDQAMTQRLNRHRSFRLLTRVRPSQVPQTDRQVNPNRNKREYLNGVMFSSKWLAEDLNLNREETNALRGVVERSHQQVGFGDGSPADWWAIVLADGDGMGQYVSGSKLYPYAQYLESSVLPGQSIPESLLHEKKRMGPATHVGLNRALLDFSNRLVPHLTEQRFCGKVIYSGGDDVLVTLPLEDLPEYLLSLRSAWCGGTDPASIYSNRGDYWQSNTVPPGMPDRPLFTMGNGATMSMGVVIAYKSVPLPTVLEALWEAEADRAKAMPGKNGICFRVIYGGGNQLEALLNGDRLPAWWNWVKDYPSYRDHLSPLLYRLAEELPQRADLTASDRLISQAAQVIMSSRNELKQLENFDQISNWLDDWEEWAKQAIATDPRNSHLPGLAQQLKQGDRPLGTTVADLGMLLRFTAFWIDKRVQRLSWGEIA